MLTKTQGSRTMTGTKLQGQGPWTECEKDEA